MVSEPRNQPMAWMETDYSKQTHFRWKIKWRLKHLGALGIMGETPFNSFVIQSHLILPLSLPSFLPSFLPFPSFSIQVVNFKLVPVPHQLNFCLVAGLVWASVVSLIRSTNTKPQDTELRTQTTPVTAQHE